MAEADWASTSVNTDTMSDSESNDGEDDRTVSHPALAIVKAKVTAV